MFRRFLAVLLFLSCTIARANGPATQPTQTIGLINQAIPLKLERDPATFHFTILADRTGGERAGVFATALDKLNLLQPDFTMSVGDLIEGYVDRPNRTPFDEQIKDLDDTVSRLKLPMFYTVGNHDISSATQRDSWHKRFGQHRYYSFSYRGVLFMVLCTMDPDQDLSPEQISWAGQTLTENADARWTVLFMHHPMWRQKGEKLAHWEALEKSLGDRPYTVFAGHVHRYSRLERNGRLYYTLATTGGVSDLKGPGEGTFDHFMWVTMTDKGPVIANLQPQTILTDDVRATTQPATKPAK